MLAYNVLKILPAATERKMQEYILSNKRIATHKLYKACRSYRNRAKPPDKAVLYKKVFGEAYTKEKDYRLRKEMKHLNDLIRDFLMHEQFRRDLTLYPEIKNYYVLKGLKRYGLVKEFERYYGKTKEENDRSMFPFYISEMHQMMSQLMLMEGALNVATLEQHAGLLDDLHHSALRQALYQYRKFEARSRYAEMMKDIFNKVNVLESSSKSADFSRIIDFGDPEEHDDYTKHLQLVSESYGKGQQELIDVAKKDMELVKRIDLNGFNKTNWKIKLSGILAVGYSLVGEFDQSMPYYQQHLQLCFKHNHNVSYLFVLNLMLTYINLGKYQEALDFFRAYKDGIAEHPNIHQIMPYKAFCHLFMGDTKSAVRTIESHEKSSLAEYFRVLHRIIYIISFILDEDFELAANELKNARAILISRQVKNAANFKLIVDLLSRFVRIQQKAIKPDCQEMKVLLDEVQELKNTKKVYYSEPSLIWLKTHLERLLA